MSSSTKNYEAARVAALEVLIAFIDRKTGTIPAARKLASLRHSMIGDKLDEDWRIFMSIDSETDHLPAGEARKHWAPDALADKGIEIREAEETYGARALDAARNLVRRYR